MWVSMPLHDHLEKEPFYDIPLSLIEQVNYHFPGYKIVSSLSE